MTLAFLALVPLVAARINRAFVSPEILNGSPTFDIQFVDSQDSTEPVETVGMMLLGHRYSCEVPLNTVDQFDYMPMDEEQLIGQALSVLNETDWCKIRLDAYWGYRYCAGKDLLQFVPEWRNKEAFVISKKHYNFTLGRATDIMTLGRKNGLTYVKTEFTNGTICDLTGDPRKADIIYYCDPEASEVSLRSINEVASCEYEAYIARPELCSIPEFVQKSHKNVIKCVDLDKEDEVVVEDEVEENEEVEETEEVEQAEEVEETHPKENTAEADLEKDVGDVEETEVTEPTSESDAQSEEVKDESEATEDEPNPPKLVVQDPKE